VSLETAIRVALSTALGANVTAVKEGTLELGDVLPVVTFNRIDTPRKQALGANNPVIGSKPRFQFDVWAVTPDSRDVVLPLLITALCALPYGVRLVNQRNTTDAATGYFIGRVDAKVPHAGA
jgi:hypothetical protein